MFVYKKYFLSAPECKF